MFDGNAVQVFLRKGTPDPKGCVVYFLVGDADELYEFHRAQGVEVAEPIEDRPYGIRDYVVRDLHGYYLRFGHHLFNAGPPVKINRVDIPVRLEKRLAGLLEDLAKHKRMSVNSCWRKFCSIRMRPLARICKQPLGISRS